MFTPSMRSVRTLGSRVVACSCMLLVASLATSQAAERTIKFAHLFSPEHSINKAALQFAKDVAELTDGRIEVTVHPSETLGTERQLAEGLSFGTIDLSPITANVIQGFEPSAGLTALPYVIRDFEHAFRVEDGPVGDEIERRILATLGARTIGHNTTGFRNVVTRDKPIRSLADFKGVKIRVPESPIMVSTFKALDANPTPIPWGELYTSLQTKVVDAAESAPSMLDSIKIFEVGKLLTRTNHMYTGQFLLINEKLWQSLSSADQEALSQAGKAYTDWQRQFVVQSADAVLEGLKKRGVQVFDIDTKPLQERVTPLYEEYGKTIGGMSLVDQALKS